MKFSGVAILQGVEFSIFPIDCEWALQQCSATALPVIINMLVIKVYVLARQRLLTLTQMTHCEPSRRGDSTRLIVIGHLIGSLSLQATARNVKTKAGVCGQGELGADLARQALT